MSTSLRQPPELVALAVAASAWAATAATQLIGPASAPDGQIASLTGLSGRGGALTAAWLAWTVMAAAMMVPTALPAARHVAENSFRWRRHRAVATFLGGYLSVWAAFGLVALSAVAAWAGWATADGSGALPADAPLLAALATSVVWQVTPWKRDLLRACGKSIPLAARGWPATRSCLHFGLRHGTRCVGSCWALMLVMATAATDHLWWTVLLAGAVLAERFSPVLRRRPQVLAVPWLSATLVIALLPTPATGAVGLPYFCSIPVG